MIGLLNKGLDLPQWVPGAGHMLSHDRKRLVFSKMVEGSLNWCILHYMFDRQVHLHRIFFNYFLVLRLWWALAYVIHISERSSIGLPNMFLLAKLYLYLLNSVSLDKHSNFMDTVKFRDP